MTEPESGLGEPKVRAALDRLTGQVVASFDGAPDPRLKSLLTDLVRQLHSYVIANDVTQEEWQAAIDFLTRAGHVTTDKRQEFVLLSDVLGVSSAVDMLAGARTPGTTPSAVLGPFYVQGPPPAEHGSDLANGLPGTPLWVDAGITDTEGNPVPDVFVDVWQSNEDGFYDVQLPDPDGPVLRARFHSDAEGRVRFWTIMPSAYPVPDDGPVGRMLAATGRHQWRAPHLHFLFGKPGYHRLITQLFVRGGPYLDTSGGRGDAVFGVKEELIADFVPGNGPAPGGRRVDGGWRLLEFTFRIKKE